MKHIFKVFTWIEFAMLTLLALVTGFCFGGAIIVGVVYLIGVRW